MLGQSIYMSGLFLFWITIMLFGEILLDKGMDIEYEGLADSIQERLGRRIARTGAILNNLGIRRLRKGDW